MTKRSVTVPPEVRARIDRYVEFVDERLVGEEPTAGVVQEVLAKYHAHLPKLKEPGYITWNEAERTIRRGPQWGEIEPLLELIYSHLCELPPVLQGKPPDNNGTKG